MYRKQFCSGFTSFQRYSSFSLLLLFTDGFLGYKPHYCSNSGQVCHFFGFSVSTLICVTEQGGLSSLVNSCQHIDAE